MPNPLLRVPRRPSKTPTDRPTPITPVPETYEGTNFAYRGTQTHGVDTRQGTIDPEGIGFDPDNIDPKAIPVLVDVYDEKDMPDPIPVRIVSEFKNEIREFNTDRRIATFDRIDEIVGRDTGRVSLRIKNTSVDKGLYVGCDRGTVNTFGWLMSAGSELTLTTEEPVYITGAGASVADDCSYQILVEFVRGD